MPRNYLFSSTKQFLMLYENFFHIHFNSILRMQVHMQEKIIALQSTRVTIYLRFPIYIYNDAKHLYINSSSYIYVYIGYNPHVECGKPIYRFAIRNKFVVNKCFKRSNSSLSFICSILSCRALYSYDSTPNIPYIDIRLDIIQIEQKQSFYLKRLPQQPVSSTRNHQVAVAKF